MHATGMDFRTKDANTHPPKAACWSTLRLKLCKMGGALETKSCETGIQVLQAETTLAEPRAFFSESWLGNLGGQSQTNCHD